MHHLRSGRSYRTVDPYEMLGNPPMPHFTDLRGGPSPGACPTFPPLTMYAPSQPPFNITGDTTALGPQIQQATSALDAIQQMLVREKPSSPFKNNILSCLELLIAQMCEIKYRQHMSDEKSNALSHHCQEMKLSTVKTAVYEKRLCHGYGSNQGRR